MYVIVWFRMVKCNEWLVMVSPRALVWGGSSAHDRPKLHVCFCLFVLFSLPTSLTLTVMLRSASRRTFVDRHRCGQIPCCGYNPCCGYIICCVARWSDNEMDANLKLLPYFNAKLIKTKKIKKMRKKNSNKENSWMWCDWLVLNSGASRGRVVAPVSLHV